MDLRKWKKKQEYITIAVFCFLIFGFAAATFLKPSSGFSETENRVLAQIPSLKGKTLLSGEFEADYEEYLTDQFIARDCWIGLKTSVERLLFKRESKDIYFADDDYLIEKHSGVFTTDTAQHNIEMLSGFVEKYQDQFGTGSLSVMIVPNAVEILADKLPPFAAPFCEKAYLEQIADALPDSVWIDTEPVLHEHSQEALYYKTDHHWKTLAAFYAYQVWAEKMEMIVPKMDDYEVVTVTESFEGTIQAKLGIRTAGDTIELFLPKEECVYTVQKSDPDMKESSLYSYPALDTRDKYAIYFGGNEPFMKIRTDADHGRKLLIIKDSYANCLIPFMLKEFQEIDVLDLRYDRRQTGERIAEGGYTDILILYNAAGFAGDPYISRLMN